MSAIGLSRNHPLPQLATPPRIPRSHNVPLTNFVQNGINQYTANHVAARNPGEQEAFPSTNGKGTWQGSVVIFTPRSPGTISSRPGHTPYPIRVSITDEVDSDHSPILMF